MPDLETGVVLNRRYRIEQKLAESRIDQLYRVQELDLQTGQPLGSRALRVLARPVHVSQPPYLPDLSLVQSPGSLPLYRTREIGEMRSSGEVFVVYDLAERTWPEGADPMLPTAGALIRALLALHQAGTFHGRLKPANLLWSAGAWTLADVGLVPLSPPPLIAWATAKGHLAWVDPALLHGHAGAENDVWGLGACLLLALTGHAPFPSGEAEDVAFGTPLIPDSLPEPWDRCVRGCLQPDLGRRWSLPRLLAVLEQQPHLPDAVRVRPTRRADLGGSVRLWRQTVSARPTAVCGLGLEVVAGLRNGDVLRLGAHGATWTQRLPSAITCLRAVGPQWVVGTRGGVLYWLDGLSGEVVKTASRLVYDVVATGTRLVAAGPEGLSVLDGETVSDWPVYRLAVDGESLLGALPDGGVVRFEARGPRWMRAACRAVHQSPVCGLAAGTSVSWDGTLMTWTRDLDPQSRVDLGAPARCLSGPAVGLQDGTVWLEDRRLGLADAPILALSWSPQDRRLAVASRRGNLDLWEVG